MSNLVTKDELVHRSRPTEPISTIYEGEDEALANKATKDVFAKLSDKSEYQVRRTILFGGSPCMVMLVDPR